MNPAQIGVAEEFEEGLAVGRTLICIGLGALAAVMLMTFRYGLGLQHDWQDGALQGALHVLWDAGGAGLMAASAVMFGWHGVSWKVLGVLAMVCSIALVGLSVANVFGFMSQRIADLEGQQRVLAWQMQDLSWKRNQTVNHEVPVRERRQYRQDTRTAEADIKRELRLVPDAAAAALAEWFSTTPERVQRAMVLSASVGGQVVKLSCLFFGFRILQRSKRIRTAVQAVRPTGSGGSPSGSPAEPRRFRTVQGGKSERTPRERLASVVRELNSQGTSTRDIAAATGWSQTTVQRVVERQRERFDGSVAILRRS